MWASCWKKNERELTVALFSITRYMTSWFVTASVCWYGFERTVMSSECEKMSIDFWLAVFLVVTPYVDGRSVSYPFASAKMYLRFTKGKPFLPSLKSLMQSMYEALCGLDLDKFSTIVCFDCRLFGKGRAPCWRQRTVRKWMANCIAFVQERGYERLSIRLLQLFGGCQQQMSAIDVDQWLIIMSVINTNMYASGSFSWVILNN